jgi:muramidase (phage lysozyme)
MFKNCKRFSLFSTLQIGVVIALSSCGPLPNDDSSELASSLAGFELVTGDQDTFIKRNIDTDTSNSDIRGTEFCTLYSHNKYQLTALAEDHGKHVKVDIIGFTDKGCEFSEGFVFKDHLASVSSSNAESTRSIFPKSSGPKVVNFLGKQATIGAVRNSSLSAKEKAFLDMIAAAEGTSNTLSPCGKADDGYQSIFGCDRSSSNLFSNYSSHPARSYATGWGTYSDAAGRYQFKSTTWNELARKHGISGFTPSAQDKGAVIKIRERGSNPNSIVSFESFNNAVYGIRLEWASMPHSPYGQKTYDAKPLYDLYLKALDLY